MKYHPEQRADRVCRNYNVRTAFYCNFSIRIKITERVSPSGHPNCVVFRKAAMPLDKVLRPFRAFQYIDKLTWKVKQFFCEFIYKGSSIV